MRTETRIESIIHEVERLVNKVPDFIVTADHLQFNAGVFLVRNSKWFASVESKIDN
jgi:hypothetical protein